MSRLRAARAGAWSVSLQLVRLGVQAGVFFLFARHLSLAVIGAYSFAYAFVQLTQAFVRTGVIEVFVADVRSDQEFAATALNASIVIGLLSTSAVFIAGLVANFLNAPGAYMFFVLGLIPLIDSFGIAPEAVLRKELKFAAITFRTTAGLVAAASICMILGFFGWGVDALISFNVSASFISTLVAIWLVRGKLRWSGGSWAETKTLLSASLNVSLSTFATGIVVPASQIALGAVAGPSAVGAYAIAQRFLGLINSVLVEPVKMAALPVLSRVRSAEERRRAMLEVVGICATIIIPVCLGFSAIGFDLFPLLLGENGAIAAPIFAILAFHCVPLIVSMASAQMLLLAGRSRDILIYTGLLSITGIITAFACASFGAEVTAFGYVARAYAVSPLALYQLSKAGGVPPKMVLKVVIMPLLSSVAMACVILWILNYQPLMQAERLAVVALAGMVGAICYLCVLALVARQQFMAVFRLLLSLKRNRSVRPSAPGATL